MKEHKPMPKPGMSVGFISLMLIFMVLCLSVFITLALISATADHNLTERTSETTVAYYLAQNQYQVFLSELDKCLQGREDEASLKNSLKPLLNEAIAYDEERGVINAQWPAGERLLLQAVILINPSGSVARYSVQSVLTVLVQEKTEKPLNNLWNGEGFFQ